MKLRTAIVAYTELDGWPNYSNHSATVTLHFDIQDSDLAGGLAELNSKLDAAHDIAEAAVARSIERTQFRRPEPRANGNGHTNGNGHAAPPPAQQAALPPPPPPPVNRVFGPVKTGVQLAAWFRGQGSLYEEQAKKLCQEFNLKTYWKGMSDETAQWVYNSLYGAGAAAANGSTR